jgi:hypothetical protein
VGHGSAGRVRYYVSWLSQEPDLAARIADALAALGGVVEVEVRPYTGSVLVEFAPESLARPTLDAALCEAAGVAGLGSSGLHGGELGRFVRTFEQGSDLARAVANCVIGIQSDVLRATGGQAGLGVLVSLSLWMTALFEVIQQGELPLPEWHQLVWWGVRTFKDSEKDALDRAHAAVHEKITAADVPAVDV